MTIFYTSDTHFSHWTSSERNIIKYSKRPFSSIDEMNKALIDNWNSVVGRSDVVYHCGDFGLCPSEEAEDILQQLNGNKFLIHGNHDGEKIKKSRLWVKSSPMMDVKDQGRHVVLCHFAMRHWNRSHHGSYMLHGHAHGSLPIINNQSLDVGVDCWDYKPVTLDQVIERLKNYPPMAREHHRSKDVG